MSDNSELLDDPEFRAEMMQTFIEECDDLLHLHRAALVDLRLHGNGHTKAISDIFRVYHTLKGDASFFPEFSELARFSDYYCEQIRPLLDGHELPTALREELSLNHSRISSFVTMLKLHGTAGGLRFHRYIPADWTSDG